MAGKTSPSPDPGSGAAPRKLAQHAPALGIASANPLGDLQALTLVNQHIARSLRTLFEPMLRQLVKVTPDPITIQRWDEYLISRGAPLASVTLIGMAPLSGQAMLMLDGAFTYKLVDLYFGGTGLPPNPMPVEFTPTAEAMIGRIAQGVAERLARGWEELAEIDFEPGRTETNPQMLSAIDGEDRVVRTRFVIAVGEARPVELDLLYPAATLKPIAGILSSKVQGRRQAEDPTWTNNLMRAAMQVTLPVRSVLAEPVIPLSQLMTLKAGDIIPISFGPEIPLLVSTRRFARGAVGASNGRAAIRVHRIEPLEDEDSR